MAKLKGALLVAALCASLLAVSADQSEALIKFLLSQPAQGQQVLLNNGWSTDSNSNPCTFGGVTCNPNGDVTKIVINCAKSGWAKLNGELHDGLAAYPLLTHLIITRCGITGEFPPSFLEAGTFQALKIMNLSRNKLSGELQSLFGFQKNEMLTLDLSYNKFTGSLQGAWASTGYFPKLKRLNLRNNPGLTGLLPELWGNDAGADWPDTLRINLCRTGITGPIPTEWTTTSMRIFSGTSYVPPDKLCGELPSQFADPAFAAGVYPCGQWPVGTAKVTSLPPC